MTTADGSLSTRAGYQHPFIDGTGYLFGVGDRPRTLCELAMARLSSELRSQKNWWLARHDRLTRLHWFESAKAKTWRVGPLENNIEIGLSDKQIEYVLDELGGYAALRDESTGIQVSCHDRIWETDHLLSNEGRDRLLMLLECLRPPSTERSLDVIVDPFRHCFVLDRTLTSRPMNIDQSDGAPIKCLSLATDVKVSSGGSSVKYLSYINGIDPFHSEVYEELRSTLSHSIPLLERALTSLHRSNPLHQRIKGSYHYKIWEEPDPPEDSDDDEAWEQHLRDVRHWALYRPIELPDVPSEGYRGELTRSCHQVRLLDRRIQVIHKVVDLHLCDARRGISDSAWHVAGISEEHIVACVLYFVCVQGIDEGSLEFRMAITSPSDFRHHDVGATLRTWGLRHGDACNQSLGSVLIRTDLAIAFPNIYQRRMRNIKLADGETEGRLTILEFFLVDPDIPPILSTADVGPQQRGCIYRALESSVDPRLPPEILEKIVDMVDSVMSEDEADKYQEEMRRERKRYTRINDAKYFSLPFNLAVATAAQ